MKKVLLHICCGVCASQPVGILRNQGYSVTGFFYNPNIHPASEYALRKEQVYKVKNLLEFDLIEIDYRPEEWFSLCSPYADEKEGGSRCRVCYRLRLLKTFSLCREAGFDFFTTTLTVSPHKVSKLIFGEGKNIGGEKFLAQDFKKKDGFRKTTAFARERGLYRQNYCGCVYSLRPAERTETPNE